MSNNQPRLSARNPFRSPAVTPNPTGASATSSIPSYSSLPPPTALPTGGSSVSTPPSYTTAPEGDPFTDDEESPEALPDLTPRISPARTPFLPPRNSPQYQPPSTAPPSLPPRTASNVTVPHQSSSTLSIDDLPPDAIPDTAPPAYSLTPNTGSGELVVQQGPRRPFQRAPEPFLQFPTAPQQPRQRQPPQPNPPRFVAPTGPPSVSSPTRPLSQMSDFAREFYSAGATTPPPDTQQEPQYAPPPGPPPPRRPRAASTSSGAGSTAPPASDGRPTTTPMPGHPLLRNGKTLVYPESYYCQKCHNTGYKNYDPSHPCRKCWDRFGKPFTSILASSPWGGQGSESSQQGRSFQRPLPSFQPPQARPRPPPMPVPMPISPGAVPPPGATVVMPGDARIGGRLCWRCGGRGVTPFLIFDELPCETCGGIGRLLN
ncbi:hypothetical protein BC827DRAFT_1228078 [Russula dissimulans]|nr:hypothetical protein BC827DRAFT_1228078 [Russula dissimulans]